jgi:hypothetical protein
LTLTVSGTVTEAQVEPVTYQTSPRAYIATTSAAVYQPRYDFDPSTVPATPRGMLIEESRANVALYSSTLTNAAWVKLGSTGATDGTVDPTGVNLATKLTDNTAAGSHEIYNGTVYSSPAGTYTGSVYCKSGSYNNVAVWLQGTGPQYATAVFNLGNQTATAASQTASNITIVSTSQQYVGNGWFRVSITATFTNTFNYINVGLASASAGNSIDGNGNVNYTGTGSNYAYLSQVQVEAGSFATSYIPATSASVTRVADIVKLSGSALTVAGAATGSAVVQSTKILPSYPGILIGGVSSTGNFRWLVYGGNTNLISSYNNINSTNTTMGSGTWASAVKTGIAWSSGWSVCSNNGTIQSTSASDMSTATAVYLGSDRGNQLWCNGWLGALALYGQRLPDNVLKMKSGVGSAY